VLCTAALLALNFAWLCEREALLPSAPFSLATSVRSTVYVVVHTRYSAVDVRKFRTWGGWCKGERERVSLCSVLPSRLLASGSPSLPSLPIPYFLDCQDCSVQLWSLQGIGKAAVRLRKFHLENPSLDRESPLGFLRYSHTCLEILDLPQSTWHLCWFIICLTTLTKNPRKIRIYWISRGMENPSICIISIGISLVWAGLKE